MVEQLYYQLSIFTASAPRPIQSIWCNVRGTFYIKFSLNYHVGYTFKMSCYFHFQKKFEVKIINIKKIFYI